VIRKRLGRFSIGLTAFALTLGLVGIGSVAAATPNWTISAVRLPTVVGAGNDAGYAVTIRNNGPSQVNALSLTVTPASTPSATPSYFSGLTWNQGGPGSCSGTGQLICDLGTLTAGTVITFTVAYAVPSNETGTFDVAFAIRAGTGDTGSDGKGKSRGDKLEIVAKTGIGASTNFDAGFVVDDQSYSTGGNLGRQNKQVSSVDVTDTLIPVTIEDGNGVATPPCAIAACASAFGEWTYLDVPGNTNLIKATLSVWGGAVPGGVGADDIYVIHIDDNGDATVIDTPCSPATGTPGNAECLTATKTGNNYHIVVWLFGNGNLRGGF
jgi:Domain of unknown function DUF11